MFRSTYDWNIAQALSQGAWRCMGKCKMHDKWSPTFLCNACLDSQAWVPMAGFWAGTRRKGLRTVERVLLGTACRVKPLIGPEGSPSQTELRNARMRRSRGRCESLGECGTTFPSQTKAAANLACAPLPHRSHPPSQQLR